MSPEPDHDAPDRTPVAFRGGGYAPRSLGWLAPVTFGCVLGVWWLATSLGFVRAFALSSPPETFAALAHMIADGTLAPHLAASLQRLILGWSLGASLGVIVGFAIGLSSLARSSALPLVSALFPIPKIALLPLFIVWLGIGEISKIAILALGTFSPMVIATVGGVDNVDRSLIRMAQSFGVPSSTIIRRIVLPGAMPGLLAGARISASIAIILLAAAEMLGAQYGIGAMVLASGNLMQVDQLIAGVIVISSLGYAVSLLIGLAERRLLRWR